MDVSLDLKTVKNTGILPQQNTLFDNYAFLNTKQDKDLFKLVRT